MHGAGLLRHKGAIQAASLLRLDDLLVSPVVRYSWIFHTTMSCQVDGLASQNFKEIGLAANDVIKQDSLGPEFGQPSKCRVKLVPRFQPSHALDGERQVLGSLMTEIRDLHYFLIFFGQSILIIDS